MRNHMKLSFLTLLMIFFSLSLLSCGTEKESDPVPPAQQRPPAGPGDPGPSIGDISYPEMQALMNNYCLSCHASARFMQSEQALRGSRVQEELTTRQMPPRNSPKQLGDAERGLMISFF